ncbi:metalloregulator ArsR/SmtB family transcription factor [Xylanimonas allomyrinae]|uniref:Metalloregulator ArsR/SmtB family transcription factor n=1 Tax=Xylanimonas allomyrinae TaxID=2509459 RepID=A0A4P6EYH0_9MICO|nr:metalloregulator ArsR/SmtB family transcription factor [Xylanimonas allomyrinae]QAY63108.1 metalloregulator ArsR/SmtB family transcription factor [Xylanimonas allomyrinae]
MTVEATADLTRRAAVHAALGDPARLRIVDTLTLGDASPSELMQVLGITSNLLSHHLGVLRDAGLVTSHRSQGDGRRQYVRLRAGALALALPSVPAPTRVLFVCSANSARSHLAAALWRQASPVPAASAGTRPAAVIHPGAREVARRRHLDLPTVAPRRLDDVAADGDLVVTVCDLAHEEAAVRGDLHWSIPDPVRVGTPAAFDAAYDELSARVRALAARLAA